MKPIYVGGKSIGPGHPCFLVAEAGTTSLGNIEIAKRLVESSAKAGFDAIKFQCILPEQLSDRTITYRYPTVDGWTEENMYEMFKSLVFSEQEWEQLADCAASCGIIFFSTVDYPAGVDIFERYNAPLYKIGAWDITYLPLLEAVAATGKPVVFDTGPAVLGDVAKAMEICRSKGNENYIFLHEYHSDDPLQMNLRSIEYLRDISGKPSGFSSPTTDTDVDFLALGLGASMIEKRITMDRKMHGHHHVLSMEPNEFFGWIQSIRRAEDALGERKIEPSLADIDASKKYYRSICSTREILAGEPYSIDNLDGKRPGIGIPTASLPQFLGRRAKRDIPPDTLLDWNDI